MPPARRTRKTSSAKKTKSVSSSTEDTKLKEEIDKSPEDETAKETEADTSEIVAKKTTTKARSSRKKTVASEPKSTETTTAEPLETQTAKETETEATKEATNSKAIQESSENLENLEISEPRKKRIQPIPPAGEPRQYRAIGLVKGKYQPSDEQLTKGNILTSDGTLIDSVILGRVISLVKKHLDLEQEHLWVVYPRVRKEDGNLHVQIVGVWEPETLKQDDGSETDELLESEIKLDNGYFSIRGEVIYASSEEEKIIVKIKQFPKKPTDKIKFFKLELKGVLPEKPVSHFWDLEVHHENNKLILQEAIDLGLVFKKKPFNKKGGRKFSPKGKKNNYNSQSKPSSDKGK